ncbi:MAG: hypothetical protein AABP62_25235 [Planctomycetota bacterium]
MSTANDPPAREVPPLSSEDPLVEQTSAGAEGAPAADPGVPAPPLSAAEELAKLRVDVQQRLQAVVAGEQQLRLRTQELKQRLTPIRKQIDALTKTLQLDHGVLASLRTAAAAEAQQQAVKLRALANGLDGESQLRQAMTEAGRLRLQQFDQLTLRPIEAWSQNAAAWNQNLCEAMETHSHRLNEFSARWLTDGETEPLTSTGANGDGPVETPLPTKEPAGAEEAEP